MITVGIDLAAQPERTAACRIEWRDGSAEVTALDPRGVTDDRLLELVAGADKSGFDVPLGWPDAFVAAVTAHHAAGLWPEAASSQLRLRATDHHVHQRTGRWPLSVSSDRIAIPAFRAAALLSRLPFTLDRSGAGRVVEVYPAAALRLWGFVSRRYKRVEGSEARCRLVDNLRARCPWLSLSDELLSACLDSDDAVDAVVSALVARAAARGLTEPPPAELAEIAAREGWIALPIEGSLETLTS